MDLLWAPWRKTYIRRAIQPDKGGRKNCLFCRFLAERKDARNYILKRSPFSFAVLNLYPYSPGHVMILPQKHTDSLAALSDAERLDFLHLHDQVISVLKQTMKPHGFNVGCNMGRIAGAGLPSHIHWHIVPRWKGDTNFMTSLADVRIIPEGLGSTYKQLVRRLGKKS